MAKALCIIIYIVCNILRDVGCQSENNSTTLSPEVLSSTSSGVQTAVTSGVQTTIETTKPPVPHCDKISVRQTRLNREREGVYIELPLTSFNCYNKVVYKQIQEDIQGEHFIYFINSTSWQGWMIGGYMCYNKGFASAGTIAEYPERINATWEEFNGVHWRFSPRMQVGCHHLIDTIHPVKTKSPTTVTSATWTSDFTGAQGTPVIGAVGDQDVGDPSHVTILLYVVVPVGCLVIIVLVIILSLLYCRGMPLPDPEKDKETQVHFDGNNVTIIDNNPDVDNDISPHRRPTSDKDSVYDDLTSPTTGSVAPPLPAYSERQPTLNGIQEQM